jgi:hypothetical protein
MVKFIYYDPSLKALRAWSGHWDDAVALLPIEGRPGWFYSGSPIRDGYTDGIDKKHAPTNRPDKWIQFRDEPTEIERRFCYSRRTWWIARDGVYHRTTTRIVARNLRFEFRDWAETMRELRWRPVYVVGLRRLNLTGVPTVSTSTHKADLT